MNLSDYSTDPQRQALHESALLIADKRGIAYLDAVEVLSAGAAEPEFDSATADPVSRAVNKVIRHIAERDGKPYDQVVKELYR